MSLSSSAPFKAHFYLLEPQSDDGLVTWNFFDSSWKNKG